MIFLSIVIPAHDAQETIVPLLASVASSKQITPTDIEVIVVDDASQDATIRTIQHFIETRIGQKLHQLKIIQLKKNSGPAHARNVGVKYAEGKFVLFLDSDVVLHPFTLYEVIHAFFSDPDLFAMTGVWDKKQRSEKFFQKFKALRDWSYWINERDPRNYYYLFSTRIAAIERGLFLRLGGFDDSYKAALIEDIELTYRIARRHAVVFHEKAIVSHEFEDFWPVAKKYFWRSYYWSKLYRERKKFDPVATTGKEALTTISAGIVAGLLSTYVILRIWSANWRIEFGIWDNFYYQFIVEQLPLVILLFLLIHLWGVRKFLLFCYREEGIVFAIQSFFMGFVLYLMILGGAVYSLIR